MTRVLKVELGERSYPLNIGAGLLADPASFADLKGKSLRVVTDANVAARYLDPVLDALGLTREHAFVLPAGETQKTLANAELLLDWLLASRIARDGVLIALGGGVIGDLTGFVAAIYQRGIAFVQMPTTLLSQVDSSVGGKTGVNHPRGKNLIGAFHQPAGVWIDSALLDSLPEREYLSGLAEVVKYGVILDATFFAELEATADALCRRDPGVLVTVVARCCRLKADVVAQDEREETGLRAVLNYGHTFAHAFEAVGGYGGWLHGEAVAAGMACAGRLAERLGRVDQTFTARQLELLRQFDLPTAPKPAWPADQLIESMRRDKKAAAGRLRFVLPTRMGHVELVDGVPESLVREVLASS